MMLQRVLKRLGLDEPPSPDVEGLQRLYDAWSIAVRFDNVRKMIALRTGRRLPGREAEDFFEAWLSQGAGGTCWAGAIAWLELLRGCGFEARFASGSMFDMGFVNHGTVVVAFGNEEWLADASLMSPAPLLLGREQRHSNGVTAVELEPDGGSHLVWVTVPHQAGFINCRVYPETLAHGAVLAHYEATRERSAFNQRLYARRNFRDRVILLRGNLRFERRSSGFTAGELTADELRRSMQEEMGFSEELIGEWVECGGLADSMKPSSGPAPPAVKGVPPSLRVASTPRE
ncbi:MAG: arylamine N-acetyltransferase [Bryobacteraceae bacterium]